MTPRDCLHGNLSRSCETCELQAAIAAKDRELAELRAIAERARWIPVTEGLPEAKEPVIVYVEKVYENKTRRLRAFYIPPFTVIAGEDEPSDYSPVQDEEFLRMGWYECNEFEETNWRIDGEVTFWCPLPAAPVKP